MAGSVAFEAACSALERATQMDRWAARGTLQLSLMDAGLETGSVSAAQLRVVIDAVLPRQLKSAGVGDTNGVCTQLSAALATVDESGAAESADAVFSRLGG
ncbi:MAG: hypothetical protein WEF50_07585 [Myxococcota bacterium]